MARNFSPTSVPTPSNYSEWYAWRKERTSDAMQKSQRISGRQIRENNLSVRMLHESGYVLDSATDEMVKQ